MKKLLVLIGFSIYASAISWSTVTGMFKSSVNSISYTVEASGYNPRVYEFDTQGYPKQHCVALFRSQSDTAPAMQCVLTNDKNIQQNKKK